MLRELWYTLKDTLQYGDLAGHWRAFRRVATGQVSPFHAAGIPTPRHKSSGEGGAAAPGEMATPPASFLFSCSTPAGGAPGVAGGDPDILSVTPICTIYPSGQVEAL